MDNWIKKISGAIIASVLALTLSSKAYADPVDEPVSDLPVPQCEEKITDPSNSDSTAANALSSGKEETSKTDTCSKDPVTAEIPVSAETESISEDPAALSNNSTDTAFESSTSDSESHSPADKTESIVVNGENHVVNEGSGDSGKNVNNPVVIPGDTDNETFTDQLDTDPVKAEVDNLKNETEDNSGIYSIPGIDNAITPLTFPAVGTAFSSAGDDVPDGSLTIKRFALAASSSQSGESDPAEQNRSAPDADQSGLSGSEESATITLTGTSGSTVITLGDTESSKTTVSDNSFWGFDAGKTETADDDSLFMVNYDGSSQTLASTNSDINILATGLNRLSSIQADGNINITGTGILLLDSISLSENHKFFLHPIEGIYDSGGVAVFLKTNTPSSTGSSSESGSSNAVYQLINGNVSGILDENYTLPDNVSLIVPDGSSLFLPSTVQESVIEHEEDGRLVPASSTTYTSLPDYQHDGYHRYEYSAPNLNIPASSELTLDNGSTMILSSLTSQTASLVLPKINVSGKLYGEGMITGGVIEFNSSATASCTFDSCSIYNNAQNTGLTIYGSNSLISSDGSSTGPVVISEGAELSCYANTDYQSGCIVSFNSGITCNGSLKFFSGNYQIFNNSSVEGKKESIIIVDPGNTEMPAPNAIPVQTMNISTSSHFIPSGSYSWSGETVAEQGVLDTALISNGILSFTSLAGKYGENCTLIEVYTISNGKLGKYVIDSVSQTGSVSADQIWLIRLVNILPGTTNTGSGGSVMSTNTSITGSGILGGSGAGSMTGGSGILVDLSSFITNNQSNENGDSGHGDNNGNDNSGSQNDINSESSDTTAGDHDAGNQPNDNTGNQSNNDNSTEGSYITPEDIKPDVKPDDLIITVTVQEMGSSSAETGRAAAQSASTPLTDAVSLEEAAPVYNLTVTVCDQLVTKLNEKITVRFSCPAPKSNRQIFAVFRDGDGNLKAFKARYDIIKEQLVFETDMLGDFAVVCIDFNSDIDSEEFYKYLERFDSVKALS
ncbi:MAG: hypothetical protein K5771_05325 [Oscillospiraceae bacterium]|nr:hypothetical protein [Oscillospiraceae bacterium]